jgi:hypothetical protein
MLAIGSALVGGCAPDARIDLDLRRPAAPDGVISLDNVYPFTVEPATFVDQDGRSVVREFRRPGADRVELVESLVESGTVVSRVTLGRSGDGGVVIHETVRAGRDLRTRFDPPMVFAPAGLAPGESLEQSLRVETFGLDDPERSTGQGEGVHTLSRLDDAFTPGGAAVTVFRSSLELRIGPALVSTTTEYALSPGVGLVRRASVRSVRVLGLVVERESETLRREDSPWSGDSADTP